MRLATVLSALSVLGAGACTAPLATESSAIIGGTRSIGDGPVVLLAGYPPDRSLLHTCTAVLVAPQVLLTAAHCIDAPNHPDYAYGVFPGDDASAYPLLVDLEPQLEPVTQVYPHPDYTPTLPFLADIGVVLLAAPLSTAPAPLPMQTTAIDATIIGAVATIVGYGQTTYQQANAARHEAVTTVQAIEDDTLVIGDAQRRACLGDSGGPAIVDGKVVGIDSYGPTGCGGPAHYRRVDTYQPFIQGFLPAPAAPDAGPGAGPDAGLPLPDDTTDEGGCAAGGGRAGGGLALALGLALAARRRRA